MVCINNNLRYYNCFTEEADEDLQLMNTRIF